MYDSKSKLMSIISNHFSIIFYVIILFVYLPFDVFSKESINLSYLYKLNNQNLVSNTNFYQDNSNDITYNVENIDFGHLINEFDSEDICDSYLVSSNILKSNLIKFNHIGLCNMQIILVYHDILIPPPKF